ncbi:MAG: hypothetical protein B0W54_11580 [Cellvibrio sp. 79]|nr:MAG: hypothetical protein B0W54_11580 [Cellvibrio sp. 79]
MNTSDFKRGTLPVCLSLLSIVCIFSAHAADAQKKEPWQLAQETEVWEPVPAVIQAPANAAPSDAIVLFDGKNLSQWQAAEGNGAAEWKVANGAFTVVPKKGDIKTKESFCDVQLHIEWMTPTQVTGEDGKPLESQARNNSGVFLQERYEIQMLDSYNNKTYPNGQAGSVYKQSIPLVNASRAPGEWQTYDIIFTAPKFDSAQKLTAPGNVTVLHNGVLVQNHVEIQGATEWIGKPVYKAHGCAPLRLQDHGNPMSFRNIWVRKL